MAGWVTGLIFFLLEKSSPYVRFHSAQSLVVFGALALVQMFLFPLSFAFLGLLSVASVAIWVYCLVMAFSGKAFRIPLAADLADKLVGSKPLPAPAAPSAEPSSAAPTGVSSGGSKVGLVLGIVAASLFLLCGGAIAVGFFAFKALSPIQVDNEGVTLKGPAGKVRVETPSKTELREMENPQPVRTPMEELRDLLPEKVGEWQRQDNYRIQKLGEEEREVTHFKARYRRNNETVDVQLWGGMGVSMWTAPWIGLAYVEEKDLYVRKTTVGGFKGKEMLDKKADKAVVWLRVGKFSVLAEQGKTDGPESVREFLQTLDLEAIAKTD